MSALQWIAHFTDEQTELQPWELVAPLVAAFVLWPFTAWPLLGAPLKLGGGALLYGGAMSMWLLLGRLERTAKIKRVAAIFLTSYVTAFTIAGIWDRLMGF